MLASLPLPVIGSRRPAMDLVEFRTATQGSTVVLHPRFASWLTRAGLDSAPAILALKGEIVCGHPDRHVVKAKLPTGRTLYLKREHVVGWSARTKNWRAGFGPVSRCEREAITLQQLESAGLPGPQWLAYGKDGVGRAFLLLDNLAGSADLHDRAGDTSLSPADRRLIAARVGSALAELHDAGFATPDLSAKHVFTAMPTAAVTIIDWQSSPAPGPVAWADRVRSLARLDASLPYHCPLDRAILVHSYLMACGGAKPRFADFVRCIRATSKIRKRHSSSREQHASGDAIRLVWVDGERAVTISELAANWPRPLEDVAAGQLTRHRSFAPCGRLAAYLRGSIWRSPAAIRARLLAQLQHSNLPAPRLLAYGQSLGRFATAESFVLTDRPPDAVPLALSEELTSRRKQLKAIGQLLRNLHRVGIGLKSSASAFLQTPHGTVLVNPDSVARRKRTGLVSIIRDFRRLFRQAGPLSRMDCLRMIASYFGPHRPTGLSRWAVRLLVRGGAR